MLLREFIDQVDLPFQLGVEENDAGNLRKPGQAPHREGSQGPQRAIEGDQHRGLSATAKATITVTD